MGEEKQPEEEKKAEEGKKEVKEEGKKEEKEEPKKVEAAGDEGDKKDGEAKAEAAAPPPPPPPPEEIVMRVYMHCEGCARKVKRSLKGFEGVEEVRTDCRTGEVVVKGRKAAEDPMKVVERVQKKSGRKVELISPIPPPKPEKEEPKKEEEKPKVEEKKEQPPVIAVVLKVHMHCEACAQEIKKRILKMKGVQAAEPDLKGSQVTVTGVFDPAKLVEYVYKRTGKHAVVMKQEPAEKPPDVAAEKGKEEAKEEKKVDDGDKDKDKDKGEGEKEKIEGGAPEDAALADGSKVELRKNEFNYYYIRSGFEHLAYPPQILSHDPYAYHTAYPPPQIFSDENPNACSVM